MLKPVFIKATNLPDAWFQTLYACMHHGRNFTIDQGSCEGQDRREFDFITVHITNPDKGELLPKLAEGSSIPNPVAEGYMDDYLPYLMTGEEKEGESYTYGQRICAYPVTDMLLTNFGLTIKEAIGKEACLPKYVLWDKNKENKNPTEIIDLHINQMELLIWTYKNKGHRNNQMIMQVGQPSDMALIDPPCLRHIDTRIQDGKLHFMPYFRSWDLYGGFPANLAAIELMKQYCAAEIGIDNGEIIASSKGLHIYDYVFEIAEAIRGKSIEEFKDNQI